MSESKGTFQPPSEPQSHEQPGFEHKLNPSSEPTKLEGKDSLHEYKAAGKLKGSNALITGGDSGIGRAIAVLYAREGANVSIVYLPEEQRDAEETKKMVENEGRECVLVAGNLMDNETCKAAVEKHVDKFGKIDVLVNNASSQTQCDKFDDIDLDCVERTFQSNILQMFAVTKYSLKHMEKGGSGTAHFVDYAATKGAIVSFTRSLAKQLIGRGIRVNAVAPGPVHTPIQAASRPQEQMYEFGKDSQLGRPGQPSEIAPSFIFLASKDSELYYGQVLHAYPLGD
ncbi:hypothetical protein UVI_02047470 [Ustilaginoidea virens]|uniref:Oxidoreductase n=1 Tax=Ustilaginoidea virens TaxID=1159556 RepID=A0A1B5L2C5_USTVR|nr:hypothetical protein UVI_02047470 [Ustilaginoidea virens]